MKHPIRFILPALVLSALALFALFAWLDPASAAGAGGLILGTALAAPTSIERKGDGVVWPVPMEEATKIWAGAIVCTNAAGYAVNGADTASQVVYGVAEETVDNTGADGALSIRVRRGCAFKFLNHSTPVTVVGTNAVIQDNATVTTAAAATNDIVVGPVRQIESDGVWVYIA